MPTEKQKFKVRRLKSKHTTSKKSHGIDAAISRRGCRRKFYRNGRRFCSRSFDRRNSSFTAKDLNVPSDISSAAFFLVAAACLENSEIVLRNVGLNPTRAAIVEVLQKFGAEIEVLNEREICNEIVGDLRVSGGENLAAKKSIQI